MTIPEDQVHQEWLFEERERYAAAVAYVAWFVENRAKMGDVDTAFMFHEFKMNVCRHMRQGFDVLGTQ